MRQHQHKPWNLIAIGAGALSAIVDAAVAKMNAARERTEIALTAQDVTTTTPKSNGWWTLNDPMTDLRLRALYGRGYHRNKLKHGHYHSLMYKPNGAREVARRKRQIARGLIHPVFPASP